MEEMDRGIITPPTTSDLIRSHDNTSQRTSQKKTNLKQMEEALMAGFRGLTHRNMNSRVHALQYLQALTCLSFKCLIASHADSTEASLMD